MSNDVMAVQSTTDETPLRVVLAKIGFDGHDRGLRVVAKDQFSRACLTCWRFWPSLSPPLMMVRRDCALL